MDELRVSAHVLSAEVVIITESWFHDEISNDLLFINNSENFRCDRKLRKGFGVCIWVNKNLSPRSLSPLSSPPSFVELVFVRFSCAAFSVLCYGMYIPPGLAKSDHDAFIDYLTFEFDRLLTLFPDDKIVIAGDFNDISTHFLSENFSLVNRVTEATRQSAILDHIWTFTTCYHGPLTL